MIIDALTADFTVLHSDADMICFKNPFKHIVCERGSCDIATMIDWSDGNYAVGFDYINPSDSTVAIYKRMKDLAATTKGVRK